jgi:hypothetical protein
MNNKKDYEIINFLTELGIVSEIAQSVREMKEKEVEKE